MNCLYVSLQGDDKASGAPEQPLRTLEEALRRVNEQAAGDWEGPVTIRLRGGVYPLTGPVRIRVQAPVTICSCEGEQAIFDGGRALTGLTEGTLNGLRCWTAPVEEGWVFHSLFANDRRCSRAALPKNGYYRIESVPGQPLQLPYNVPGDRFVVREGDFAPTRNLQDVLAHVFHYWADEQMPVQSYDPQTRLMVCSRASAYTLHDDNKTEYAKYRLENLFEGLTEPGDWYLDRSEGRLYYLPREGEILENTRLIAPVCEQALLVSDSRDLRIENITIRHLDWDLAKVAPQGQGAAQLPGAVSFERCARCALIGCAIEHIGYYAVDVGKGCASIRIAENLLRDMGAGGVKINGSDANGPLEARTHHVSVCDNRICEGGRQFLAGIGVLSMHAHHVTIAHNEIGDLYYSGVSCGWVWGYAENVSHDNRIEYNHIWDIGHGVLSDMGGIYTLGVQPGTVIRYNLIHDVERANYGGWAIYPDEGSSHLLIENNVCYRTGSTCFHQHYGRENIVRNNLFAFGREGGAACTRLEEHVGFTFEHNVVLTDDRPFYVGPGIKGIRSDMNLFWDLSGREPRYSPDMRLREPLRPTDELRESGMDRFSRIADPLLKDPAHGDFAMAPDSPAREMGFSPIDLTGVGVRAGRGLSRQDKA